MAPPDAEVDGTCGRTRNSTSRERAGQHPGGTMFTRTFPLVLAALASLSLCACSDSSARPITGSTGPGAASAPVMDMSTSGGGHIATFVSNGAFAELSDFNLSADGKTLTSTNLSVQKGTIDSPLTFLEYDVSQCTMGVCTDVLEGGGTIPNE